MNSIQQEYNHAAHTYNQQRDGYIEVTTNSIISHLSHLPKDFSPSTILDIGCGTGILLSKLQKKYPDATLVGVDLSSGMLNNAGSLLPHGTFIQGDFLETKLPHQTYDLIVSSSAFHFMNDYETVFQKIGSLMKPSSHYVFSDYCCEGFFVLVDWYFRTFVSGRKSMNTKSVHDMAKIMDASINLGEKFWYKKFHLMTWYGSKHK